MEKHQAFLRMMAHKKNLEKTGEGTSSPSKKIVTASATPSRIVNTTLKVFDTQTPSADAKPTNLDASKSKVKRKLPNEKTPSPPKKRKFTVPLLTGPLDPNVHVVERLQYSLTLEERKPFKGMSPNKSLNMAYELIARASVCMNYFAGTTKPLLVTKLEDACKDLETAKKENTTLSCRLEEIEKTAEEDRGKAATALSEAQNLLKRSIDTLKLDL